MNRDDVQIGSTITNGSRALRITERVERDPRWNTSGWRGINIPLEEFGGNRGMSSFVPDHLLESWHHLPFGWCVIPGNMEERYVWAPGWRWLNREVRVRSVTEAEREEAARENWARGQVAAAGKSWATHLVKFDGTVIPR